MVVVGGLTWALFRLRVSGVEGVPDVGPGIVAANHISALDGIALPMVIGRDRRRMTRFIAGAEFFRSRAFGWALRSYRMIPLRRGEGDVGALDEAIRTVRSGALVGIFPEGRVNPRPEQGLQRGRSGVARIALATGAPVIPVGIWGTHLRYPKPGLHLRRPWRPPLAFAFGAPMWPTGDAESAEDAQAFTQDVMDRIEEQVERARRMA